MTRIKCRIKIEIFGGNKMPLKVTSWNIKHAHRLITDDPSEDILERQERVRDTIIEIEPDILCVEEGPIGEVSVENFCTQILDNQWVPILLDNNGGDMNERKKAYQTKGTQWIWFLVRDSLKDNCRLQPPTTWQFYTEMKKWKLNFWGEEKATTHSHYRHPQVLIYDLENGENIEIIGVHLKSTINTKKIKRDTENNLIGSYLTEALESRIKLATEARNIRQYVAAKFDQLPHPGIIIMGDCNDGPGHDFFEKQYLFFDLISNLQGEVMIAERFFNHALFDFPGHLRWTAKYRDKVQNIPASENPLLLDHILISQPLCRGELSLMVNENAGQVEHEIYERVNAGSNYYTRSSDHRPVTCVLDDTD